MRKIALISTYTHPARDSIERMLAGAFPELEIENITLLDVVKRHRSWLLPNLCHVAAEYGRAIAASRTTARLAYFRTTYLFDRLRTAMRRLIDPSRHAFSFQMMSLYDTSVPGVPHFVYTDHTHLSGLRYPDFDRRELRPAAWIARERTLYEHAAAVFTFSSDVARDLVELYGIDPGRTECVYAGSNVDVAPHVRSDPARYAAKRILFVGIDWERKGGPELVRAFKTVLEAHPDARLTIAGANVTPDGPSCTVLGRLAPRALSRHFAEASVFCLPTRLEPFGIAFVEAMAHRLPIVATRVGALPDMVEDGVNGFLVEPGDVAALARALIRLLDDPQLCARFGERGQQKAQQQYTWRNTGERIRASVLARLGDRFDRPAEARCA